MWLSGLKTQYRDDAISGGSASFPKSIPAYKRPNTVNLLVTNTANFNDWMQTRHGFTEMV